MTVKELKDRLEELIKNGNGDVPVATTDGPEILEARPEGSMWMQTVCYLLTKKDLEDGA